MERHQGSALGTGGALVWDVCNGEVYGQGICLLSLSLLLKASLDSWNMDRRVA